MQDLVRRQQPVEDSALPVGEPLPEDLVATELVAPDSGRNIAPVGMVVQVDVEE